MLKIYSHSVSYVGFCSTKIVQIHNSATLYVAYPILIVPCLLAPKVARASAGMILTPQTGLFRLLVWDELIHWHLGNRRIASVWRKNNIEWVIIGCYHSVMWALSAQRPQGVCAYGKARLLGTATARLPFAGCTAAVLYMRAFPGVWSMCDCG